MNQVCMEVNLAIFKVLIKSKNHTDYVVEIEAESSEEARRICQKIKDDNESLVRTSEKFNVYISNQIQECSLYKLDWRDEFLKCLNLGEKSENDI